MISTLYSQFTSHQPQELKEVSNSGSSYQLFGRFTVNGEKLLLFSNIALLTAGIAYAFFMKLPLIMFCLAGYGIAYLVLQGKLQQSRPSETTVSQLQNALEVEREKNTVLGEKFKKNLSAKDAVAEIEEDIKTKSSKLANLTKQEERITKEVAKLRAERDGAKSDLQTMNQVFEKLKKAASNRRDTRKFEVITELKKELGL